MEKIKKNIKRKISHLLVRFLKSPIQISNTLVCTILKSTKYNCCIDTNSKINFPYQLNYVSLGAFSYIAQNSIASYTEIGKYCSIGPNFFCGWGIHPSSYISSSPFFYSINNQCSNHYLVDNQKFIERKQIVIGNDVFIGANVTILDGVHVGDGVIIGACSLVNKDVPPYAIIGGIPARIIKYRFSEEVITKLLRYKWWNNDSIDVQRMIVDNNNNIDNFLSLYESYINHNNN